MQIEVYVNIKKSDIGEGDGTNKLDRVETVKVEKGEGNHSHYYITRLMDCCGLMAMIPFSFSLSASTTLSDLPPMLPP